MTLRTPPPSVLASARVVAYAYVDDVPYKKWGSFCGKRSFEITGLVEGKGVAICRGCVEDFCQDFHDPGGP